MFSFLSAIVGESSANAQCKDGGPSGEEEVSETDWLGRPTGKMIKRPSETYSICGKCSNAGYKCANYSCHKLSGYVEKNGQVVGYRYGIYTHIKLGTCVTTNSKKDKCKKCRLKGTNASTLPACHTETIYYVDLDSSCSGNECCNRFRSDVALQGSFPNYSSSSINYCISEE
jgi:hypothetical protein